MATNRKNKTLHLSLCQDVKALNTLSTEMIQKTNSKNVVSWLYPSQSQLWIVDNAELLVKNSNADSYVNFLEIIVDRLYVIVNLINDYLDAMTKTKLQQRNILRLKRITLGLSVNVLWQKIQQFDFITENQNQTSEKILVKLHNLNAITSDQDSQAERTTCESCQTGMKCIKTVAQEIEALGKSESIPQARSRMREIIFDAPQSEGMNLITTAIAEDVRRLGEILRDLERKVETMEESSRDLRYEHQDSLRKLEVCEKKIRELEETHSKEQEKRNAMSSLVNKLYHEKHQMEISIQTKDDVISDLENIVEENNEKIYNLQREINKLEESVSDARSCQEILSAEKELWKIRFTNAHKENAKIKAANEELSKELRTVENKIGVIGEDFDKLDKKIERSAEDIDKTKQAYDALLKKTQDVVNSKLIITHDNINNNNILTCKHARELPTNDIEVQGNPLIDMTKQVELNKINIRKLEAQNERLLKTIRRVKEITYGKDLSLET